MIYNISQKGEKQLKDLNEVNIKYLNDLEDMFSIVNTT